MKKYTTLILLIVFINSCKDIDENSNVKNENIIYKPLETKTVTDPKNSSTYLCKINGKDWSYTKASGIVSRHKKTNKRTAIFTFTKHLEKGKDIVQLFYDGDSYKLEQASIHLKVPKKGGGMMTAMYIYHPDTMKFHSEAKISGTIDLSNPSNASGNAEVSKLMVRFNKENIENEEDGMVTATDINFTGIGYSEAGKLYGANNK